MALQTAVSAPTCGVKPVDILQSSEHGGMICNPDEECGKVPSEGRMRDFLSFLDQTASNPFYYGSQKPKKSDTPGDSTSNAALLSKISALEVELEDKEHNLKALHELRQREKLEEQRLRKQLQQQLEGDLTRTSEKYEQQCRKQQELLSQLQDEKKILASRYERLTEEMRELERRFAAKAAELHKQYGRELERQRRAFLSGEKARREAWARERAQEIKEITIKGLEPEIQRLINKHRAEKRCLEEKLRKIPDDMKKQLEEELAAQKAAVQRQMEEAFEVERIQHRQEIRTLKENYEAELGKEREAFAAKQKQQNAKWEAQITDGKNRIQGEIIKAREEEQLRLKEVTAQLLSEMEQQRNKHIRELQQTEAAAKAKEEEIIIQMSKDKETAVKEATEQTKKEVQEEAHKKIEQVLERLSAEQLAVQSQAEKIWGDRLRESQKETEEIKQQMNQDKVKLENDLKVATETRLGLERQISRLEAEGEMKEKHLKELKTKFEEIKQKVQALQREKEMKTGELEKEWKISKDRFEEQKEELEAQRARVFDLSSKLEIANKQIEEMKIEEDKRMQRVENKVRETIEAKDKQIQMLADHLAASNTKAEHLRSLMLRRRDASFSSFSAFSFSPNSVSSSVSSTVASSLSDKEKEIAFKGQQGPAAEGMQTKQTNSDSTNRIHSIERRNKTTNKIINKARQSINK